eukprot:12503204-Alexandrium_andersonii.AAC.1
MLQDAGKGEWMDPCRHLLACELLKILGPGATGLGPPLARPGNGALQAPHHARLARRAPVAERVGH